LDFGACVEAYRVVVNAPCSQGAAGFATNLAPTFTIGTGFFGRSSVGENVGPQHLVHWTRIALHKEATELAENLSRSSLPYPGPLPDAPSDGVPRTTRGAPQTGTPRKVGRDDAAKEELREEIRRIIADELRQALGR
ncbi:MAG TPA: hypothetical protein VGO85_12875, partial [Caldimonas sp.]|nr:hypothetical protein [Caldimonas sp.]